MSLLQTLGYAIRTSRLGEVPRWHPKRVALVTERRLRRLVRHTVRHSPYFARKYRGLDLDQLELSDIPTSTKDELRLNFNEAVTDRRVCREDVEAFIADRANLGRWYQGRYAVSHTSGSQGSPLLIVQDRRALEILFGIMSSRANAMSRPTISEGLRRWRSPARIAIVAQQRGFYPSGAAFEFMPQMTRPFVKIEWLSATQDDLFERLNDFQPNVLVGYATVLDALALQSHRLTLRSLQQLGNSSEQLTARARARIERAFGAPVLDHYGLGECLHLSEGCRTDGGAHINADWAILEVVDDDNRPVPKGETGSKVLVTNLANTVQPFIRYEVGDQVALATTTCGCGNRMPRIARIEGRRADLFWVRNANGYRMLPGAVFHNAVDSLQAVREWQAVQVDRDRIEVRLALLPSMPLNADLAHKFLLPRLREFGLPDHVQVDVRIVAEILPERRTGKLKRLQSLVGPPAELGAA